MKNRILLRTLIFLCTLLDFIIQTVTQEQYFAASEISVDRQFLRKIFVILGRHGISVELNLMKSTISLIMIENEHVKCSIFVFFFKDIANTYGSRDISFYVCKRVFRVIHMTILLDACQRKFERKTIGLSAVRI